MKISEKPVIIEQTFPVTVERLWQAITDPGQMRQWFFENIPAFKAEPGFETRFNVQSGDRIFPHLWKITKVIPLKLIKYNWKYGGYPGDSSVTFEIMDQEKGSQLRLTHQVTEDFPEDIDEFSRDSCHAGWSHFIKNSLRSFFG